MTAEFFPKSESSLKNIVLHAIYRVVLEQICAKFVFQEFAHKVIIPVTNRTICHQHRMRIFAVGPRKNSTIFGRGHNGANDQVLRSEDFRLEKPPGVRVTSSFPGS